MQLRLANFRAVSASDRAATVRQPFKLSAVRANESKIVLPHVRGHYGQKGDFRDEEGSRLGERAPIPRDSFVVPSNCGLPSPSKVSPGPGRGMGTSRSGGARSLLQGLRQPGLRPTPGSTGENCGVWRACLRLVGQGVSLVLLRAT